jgi:hypothetical protein
LNHSLFATLCLYSYVTVFIQKFLKKQNAKRNL